MTSPQLLPPHYQDMIYAHALDSLFNRLAQASIQIVSFDCFDTLIWRKTATPIDVFLAMQNHPVFQEFGMTAAFRQNAEVKAIQKQLLKNSSNQVTLRDIYLQHNPSLSESDIARLIQAEFETELQYTFAFLPIINLIKKAHAHQIKIIIVSDTYFLKNQLSNLIQTCAPEIAGMIHEIFCSAEYGRGKVNGLFEAVLQKTKVDPKNILHIGDNYAADYVSARTQGMRALHFIQQDESVLGLFRLQEMVAAIFQPDTRVSQPLMMPFRALIAQQKINDQVAETLIGYASLGPIIYTFAQYLKEEIVALRKTEKSLKVVFLMRDAYLPALACQKMLGEDVGYFVRVSRFTATAASFRTEDDILQYLISLGKTDRFHDIGRQLLLPEKVLEPLIKVALRSQNPGLVFSQGLLKKEITRIIINKSEAFRNRLSRYLAKTTGMKAGDTLLLVDLGYSATVQQLLTPWLTDAGVSVIGRYLVALATPQIALNKKGLMDSSWCDIKVLHALVAHIAGLEQLCTTNEPSVVDYDETGNVIYSDVALGKSQYVHLSRIQAETLRFVTDAMQYYQNQEPHSQSLRITAMTEIARMLFLPTEPEINYLKNFNFDINLGTKDVLELFNIEKGLAGLRRRGLFFMESPNNTKRVNYPAELRAVNFELAMTYLIRNRFNVRITLPDILPRQELIKVLLHQGTRTDEVPLEAVATHDGYYALCAPVGTGITFLFGKKYQFIEIEDVELVNMEDFIQQTEGTRTESISSKLQLHEMAHVGGSLYKCASAQARISFMPEQDAANKVVRFVFRPIVKQVVSYAVSF